MNRHVRAPEGAEVPAINSLDLTSMGEVTYWPALERSAEHPTRLLSLLRKAIQGTKYRLQRATRSSRLHTGSSNAIPLDRLILRDLTLMASLGIYAHEKEGRQPIRINLDLKTERSGPEPGVVCYEAVANRIKALVEAEHISLVEHLAERIAELCLADIRVRLVCVRIEKLSAIADAAGAGVEITRIAKP